MALGRFLKNQMLATALAPLASIDIFIGRRFDGRVLTASELRGLVEANRHHFDRLDQIVEASGVSREGDFSLERFEAKRTNLASLARKASSILEIGFNAGFSCLLMHCANPEASIHGVDIAMHGYTVPCAEYLSEISNGQIKFIRGDSFDVLRNVQSHFPVDVKFDLIHIDGYHAGIRPASDAINALGLAAAGGIFVLDDTDIPKTRLVFEFLKLSELIVPMVHPKMSQRFHRLGYVNHTKLYLR